MKYNINKSEEWSCCHWTHLQHTAKKERQQTENEKKKKSPCVMSNIYFYLLHHLSGSMGNMPFGSIHRQTTKCYTNSCCLVLFYVASISHELGDTIKKRERVF